MFQYFFLVDVPAFRSRRRKQASGKAVIRGYRTGELAVNSFVITFLSCSRTRFSSDGDEGLERVREREFPQALWLLDRWHIAQKVPGLVADNQGEHRRIMAPVWKADSEAVLEALRISPLRKTRPLEFSVLFGYILSNREGIDNWHVISAGLRRSLGRSIAPVRAGSGAIEKNIEVHIKTALSKTKINPGWPSFAPPPTDN